MKRWGFLIVGLIVVALIAVGARHVITKRAQQERETAYAAALHSYSDVLTPGMTRKEVEDYLSAKNTHFRQMCCVTTTKFSKRVYDDLVKIGEEDAPWFCSEYNVYIAFQFNGPERHSGGPTAEISDTLSSVTVYRWLEGCL
jgi:hypothetical protein